MRTSTPYHTMLPPEFHHGVVTRVATLRRAAVSRSKRRGAEITELALTLPVIILLLFGIMEFGRMVMVAQVLTNAAREGCRAAVLPGGTDQECKTAIQHYLNAGGVTQYTTPTISPTSNTAAVGTPITVTVSVPLNQAAWFPPHWLKNKSLTSKVVMNKE